MVQSSIIKGYERLQRLLVDEETTVTGDQLDWSLRKYGDDELVMVVRKEGKKLEQNIILFEYVESERRKTIKKLKDLLSEEEIEEINK